MVDDQDPVNRIFADERRGAAPQPRAAVKRSAPKEAKPPAEKPVRQGRPDDLYELERQSKTVNIEAQRKAMALTEARIARMHGELMPTDVVKMLFSQHFREVNTQFKQGIDGILSEFGKKLHANGNQLAEMRGVMTKILNDSVKRAVTNSKNHIENVLKELAQAKK